MADARSRPTVGASLLAGALLSFSGNNTGGGAGGGMLNTVGSDPTLTNVTFSLNFAGCDA